MINYNSNPYMQNTDKPVTPERKKYDRYILGRWRHYDCNNCAHVSITEEEQHQFCDNNPKAIPPDHACQIHRVRVYHDTKVREHDAFLYPCKKCNGRQYQERQKKND